MAPLIADLPEVPGSLLELLKGHLPYSLSLLRRLQFARHSKVGKQPSAHVLFAAHSSANPGTTPKQFAAAYVDFTPRPQTAIWIYSSAEYPGSGFSEADDALVLALLGRARSIETSHVNTRSADPDRPIAKVGALAEPVRQRLLLYNVRLDKTDAASLSADNFELCGKWLFRVDELPPVRELPEGFVWDAVRREDCELAQSRTKVNRTTETLLTFPGKVLRAPDGTPAAWCFLGYEGALSSLHVEEPYRGKGLAKAIACRIMRDHLGDYGDDGWGSADVNEWNLQSQGVCKSLGGTNTWVTSWCLLHLDTVEELP